MNRSRALSVKRRPTLESLESRETPAVMSLSSAWANSLRANAISTDTTANPPSTNISVGDDGTLNPPGTLSPDGMSTTFSPSIRNRNGATVSNPRSTNITRGDDGTLNPPGNLSPDGLSTTFSLRM